MFRKLFLNILFMGCLCSSNAYADFINGGFESAFTIPSPNTIPYVSIPEWTSTGYTFYGYNIKTLPPKSLVDIKLAASTKAPLGITDIVSGSTQTLFDYFLSGAQPTTTLRLPEVETQTAMINVRSITAKHAVSGTAGKPSGWSTFGQQATSLSQTITIQNSDISGDGKVHIRFKIAAIMENPAHSSSQQPWYAVQINNLTTGRTGSNPLYFQWSYANQPGVPWNLLTQKGTNSGSNGTYQYLNWQNNDLSFSSSQIAVGDQVEFIVIASGCSPGGHDGHVYLDNVTTQNNSAGLLISATGPATTTPGSSITYTYTYQNNGSSTANNVKIEVHIPVTQNSSVPLETIYASYSPPAGGSCAFNSNRNVLICTIPNLPAAASGTFQMTVNVPGDWPASYGPINHADYPIRADSINPVLGNLVQTEMLPAPPPPSNSFLVVDVTGLGQPSLESGVTPYNGTYTCSNTGAVTAPNATCNISGLPSGLSVSGCTISPSSTIWVSPADIPVGTTVTCQVSGTAVAPYSQQFDALVTSDSTNNTNTSTNIGHALIDVYNNPVNIPATLNGSTVLSPAPICCGRPVLMFELPITGDLPSTYSIIGQTGNIRCEIGVSGNNQFVKVIGRPGTCTVQGMRNGEISAPLVLVAS